MSRAATPATPVAIDVAVSLTALVRPELAGSERVAPDAAPTQPVVVGVPARVVLARRTKGGTEPEREQQPRDLESFRDRPERFGEMTDLVDGRPHIRR